MPVIIKVLNSSVILVNDGEGEDYIVLQKGVGYGRKPGQLVDVEPESKIYVPLPRIEKNQLIELLSAIPAEYLEVTRLIVEEAERSLHTKLNEHLYLALTDHLQFAVDRLHRDLVVTNRVFWELKTFYPKEYHIGLRGLEFFCEKMNIQLPEEEAANIAFHIINAQHETSTQYDAMRAAKLISRVQTLVIYTLKWQPDRESIHYSRFISHMQYFAERFFSEKMLESDDDFLYDQIQREFPAALNCAEKIRTQLIHEYNRSIPNEEVAYLAIHIHRLTLR